MIDRDEIAREQARLLREKGMSLRKTAATTGLTKDVVRNISRKITVAAEDDSLEAMMQAGNACSYCGGAMEQHGGSGRPRRFCSDYCRRQYWRLHRPEQRRKENKLFLRTCAYCGKTIQIYGKNDRKYCCREHYRLHFYGCDLNKSEAESLVVPGGFTAPN